MKPIPFIAGALLALAGAGCAHQERAFDFALIGDMPYTRVQQQEYQRVLSALNAAALGFVVHVGDFQFDARPYNQNPAIAAMPCVDESYQAIFDSFQSVHHALILTPGDNDWTDCWPLKAQRAEPLELLAKLRSRFFPDGRSLGQRPIEVKNQSDDARFARFRENLRWSMGGVTFVTLHIVGSNDNFGRTPQMDAEHLERKAANLQWMKQAFAEARETNSRGVVMMIQANPGFENFWPAAAKTRYFIPFIPRGGKLPAGSAAFEDYIRALAAELEGFDKPVALLHGDTHLHRVDKPLYSAKSGRLFENFTRVETFGWPDTHWVRITVDPADPQLFRFKAEIVPGNAANRQ